MVSADTCASCERVGRLPHTSYNFAQHIADQGFDVYLFNAGHRAIDNERFANSKAETYWSLREWMQQGAVSGLNDLETEAQLSSIRYHTTTSGQTAIKSKEDARKHGVRSPDRGRSDGPSVLEGDAAGADHRLHSACHDFEVLSPSAVTRFVGS
jgi:hypothetical protein